MGYWGNVAPFNDDEVHWARAIGTQPGLLEWDRIKRWYRLTAFLFLGLLFFLFLWALTLFG